MFHVRQAVRLGARLTRVRCPACQCCVSRSPIALEPRVSVVATAPRRYVHEGGSADVPQKLGELEGKMKLMFTCKKCKTRNSKLISKLAYNKGVVIVRCDGCKNNHLIADNLGWFSENNKGVNIEKLLASKGESVRKIMNDVDGYIEAVAQAEFDFHRQEAATTKDSEDDEHPAKIEETNKNSVPSSEKYSLPER